MVSFLEQWQDDYERATHRNGSVKDVYGEMDKSGGLLLRVEVLRNGKRYLYTPYYNPSPGDDEHKPSGICCCELCEFELDNYAWVDSMTSATDWGTWNWQDPIEI